MRFLGWLLIGFMILCRGGGLDKSGFLGSCATNLFAMLLTWALF